MLKIDSEEKLAELDSFLESNILYSVGTSTNSGMSCFEAVSIENGKLLVSKTVLTSEMFFKIMNKFVESRNMLMEEKHAKYFNYNLTARQGEASISVEGNTCNIVLYSSICDENVLAPSDKEFLNNFLSLIDNGCEPVISAKSNEKFCLMFGKHLTVNFDRKLLKYIEEYAVNSKHTQEYIMRLERKKENEK